MAQWGIKSRIIMLTILPTITVALLLGIFFINIRLHDITSNIKSVGSSIAYELAPKTLYGLYTNNKTAVKLVTNAALIDYQALLGAAVYKPDGKLIDVTGELPTLLKGKLQSLDRMQRHGLYIYDHGNSFTIVKSIMFEPININDKMNDRLPSGYMNRAKLIGWLVLKMSKTQKVLTEYQAYFATLIIAFIGLAISILLGLWLGRYVATPIVDITHTVDKIKNGVFKSRVTTPTSGELSTLKEGINSMAVTLEQSHEQMQKNIDKATADLRETMAQLAHKNAQLDEAKNAALQASDVKSQFLANMSHEIRTPMNAVMGFTDLLLKTKLTHEQRDYLQTIQSSADNLLTIINDILDFSKIEAGKMPLQPVTINLRTTIEDILQLLAPTTHSKALELALVVYDDVPDYIIADPVRLKQVLINLVNNAVKFTDQGSITVRVSLEQQNANQTTIKFTIDDTGSGMDKATQDRLFQAFSQGDSSSSRQYGGTGLGLVISKNLVEAMGGDIRVNSVKEKGSSFTFTIQCQVLDEVLDNILGLESRTILICEPFGPTRIALIQLLENHGAAVVAVNQLTDVPKGQTADLVMLSRDKLTGIDILLKTIKPIRGNSKTPVVIMANYDEDTIQKFISKRRNMFALSKPYRQNRLLTLMANIFGLTYMPSEAPEQLEQEALTESVPVQSYQVLVVDDHPANLKLVAAMLKDLGCQAHCIDNGADAIKFLQNNTVDLVLMDVQMPGMSGIEACQVIRNTIVNPPKIIALTADVMTGQRERLLAEGFDGYQAKPIALADLQQLLAGAPNTEPSEQTTDGDNIIDMALGQQLAGGNLETAKTMLTLLADSLPPDQKTLTDAFNGNDIEQMQVIAHRIHGAACYCGTPALKLASKTLEASLKQTQKIDPALYHQLLDVIAKTNKAIHNA